jgi:GTP cyclohydrolase II
MVGLIRETVSAEKGRIERLAEADLPTRHGRFRLAVYVVGGSEIKVLTSGDPAAGIPTVRLHSECLTGDVLSSLRCDCGEQLEKALDVIGSAPYGILLYLPQEGRGIGLANKIRAYALQDQGMDTVEANVALGLPVDARDYGPAAALLRALGVSEMRLLTNNPAKVAAMNREGIAVRERLPLVVSPHPLNREYLRVKVRRMGHTLPFLEQEEHAAGHE